MLEAGAIAHRPIWLKISEPLLRRLLGEMATILVDGPCVLPDKLRLLRYPFRYRTFQSALLDFL